MRRPILWAGAYAMSAMLAMLSFAAEPADVDKPAADATAANAAGPSPDHAGERPEVSEPDGYRMDDYRQPVPRTLKGARVIGTEEAERIWNDKTAIFIDVFPKAPKPPNLPAGTVWRDPRHMSIPGGRWLPNVGNGALTSEVEDYFKRHLEGLTGGDKGRHIIFYCLKDCWMSWNAAKRAMSWGYANVTWFPDGTDGWTEAGNDIVYLASEP
jgi:PQQ-dependent catabolism-associated CXXCW motif protein